MKTQLPARLFAITSGCLLASWILSESVLANPTGKQPNRALAAHGTIEEAKGLAAELYQLYDEEEKNVNKFYSTRDNPARWSDRQLSKTSGRLWKARRDAKRLKLMGETAGDDIYKKLFMLAVEVDKFGLAYRVTPRGSQLVQRYTQQLNREKPRFTKFLQQADRAIGQAKLELVETQLEAKGVELYEKLVYYSPSARKPYNTLFYQVLGKNDNLLEKKRKDEYRSRALEATSKNVAAATEFPAEAKRIRDQIAATGLASLGENKQGGPVEAFAHVAELWGKASAGLVRATAIVWAFTGRRQAKIEPTQQQLKHSAIGSLASIIDAAAASTPPEKVQQTYSDLLQQISVVDRRLGPISQDVRKGCESALSKLAAKDPALSSRIESYRNATAEPLRWRKLFASQHAKTLGKDLRNAIALLNAQSEVPSHIRPEFTRPPGKTMVGPTMLSSPASWIVHEASVRLIGKPVVEQRMIRLTPTSRTAVIPFQDRHYGNVPAVMQSDVEFADLKTAVVVDDTHGPLSIETADAVSSAEMQDYVVVAGPIEQVHLEALVTRYIGLPDVAYMLAPFGRPPLLDEHTSPLDRTCWRLDIRPVWAQHRYFTVVNQAK